MFINHNLNEVFNHLTFSIKTAAIVHRYLAYCSKFPCFRCFDSVERYSGLVAEIRDVAWKNVRHTLNRVSVSR